MRRPPFRRPVARRRASLALRVAHRLALSATIVGVVPAAAFAGSAAVGVASHGPAPAREAGDPIRLFVEREAGQPGRRVEVTLGTLDPRLQLAPCARVQPWLPAGARLWGRSAIGLRCVDGAAWSVTLPVTVAVFGPALVATTPLAAGATPGPADVEVREVELSREPGTPLADPAQLQGRALVRPMAAGQVLHVEQTKIAATIAAGDPVRVRWIGAGFTIVADGQALAAAGEGQSLRVRTESGRIVAGTLRGREVELRP